MYRRRRRPLGRRSAVGSIFRISIRKSRRDDATRRCKVRNCDSIYWNAVYLYLKLKRTKSDRDVFKVLKIKAKFSPSIELFGKNDVTKINLSIGLSQHFSSLRYLEKSIIFFHKEMIHVGESLWMLSMNWKTKKICCKLQPTLLLQHEMHVILVYITLQLFNFSSKNILIFIHAHSNANLRSRYLGYQKCLKFIFCVFLPFRGIPTNFLSTRPFSYSSR